MTTSDSSRHWRHDELASDLAKHLRANGNRMVWQDMQMGPSGSPRPDVYVIEKSYSRFCPTSYECKISRSDFRSDVTAAKWQSYLDFSSAVIFAAPNGLLTRSDIPAGAGLILRYDSGWRMALKPTFGVLPTLPRDSWMKLLIDGVHYVQERMSPRFIDDWKKYEIVRKKIGNEIAALMRDVDSSKYRLEHELQKLREAEKNAESERLKISDKIRAEALQVDESRIMLAAMLGLETTASVGSIRAACHVLIRSIKRDEAYRQSRYAIENAMRELQRARLTLPKIGEDDVG